ncbi:MAG TPA: tetratricopeptide repeat protein [Kofleriaceae bacterium]
MSACPGDMQLAAFVEHAITPDERAAIEDHVHACASCREIIGHAVAVDAAEPELADLAAIGRFTVQRVLGTGGMGVVYAAHDPELDRDVAIKLLRGIHASAEARQRLLREAQALAKIDHRNVIKVHDVGSHRGQIYIAMELADAGNLRAWLATRPALRELVALFVEAARGLAAAHAVGLVHRDVKPDNVLLCRGGRVCVTDFGLVGIERGSEPEPQRDQSLTRTGAVMGTPRYMSPEQFRGEPATAASDQFSLCVALYEAVYGAHPFGGATFEELSASVTRGELLAAPAGRRVPRWLRRALVRGLALDPAARFPAMTALIAALDRGRARRRAQVAGIALGVAAVAAALAVGFGRSRAIACGDGAGELAAVWNPARRVQLQASFAASGRPHAAETFARVAPIVDAWGAAWTVDHRGVCEATHVRGEQSERALDVRMSCLTDKLDQLGATLDVLGTGDGVAVDRALDAVLRLPDASSCARATELAAPPLASVAAVAERASIAARVDRANAELELGHYAAARTIANAALGDSRAVGDQPIVARAARVLGQAQRRLADRAALASFREAIRVARASHDTATEVAASADLADALAALAGKYDAALEVVELADAAAATTHLAPEVAIELDDARGDVDLARGKPALARTAYERALARGEKELGPDHVLVLTTLAQLGHVAQVDGKLADARRFYERVLAARQRIEAPDHPDVAGALDDLGNVARAESKLDDAKALYDRALAIRIAALGRDHPAVADSYDNLGAFSAERGDPVAARAYFEQAMAIYKRADGDDSVELAITLTHLGNALVVVRDYKAATPVLERARAIFEAKLGAGDLHVAYTSSELGVIAEREGRLDDALAMIRRAEQIAIAAQGADHPDIPDYLEREASVLESQNKLAEATSLAVRAVELYRSAYGGEHPRLAQGLGALAQLQGQQNDYAGALASWQQALAIFDKTLPRDHPNVSFALNGIGDALTELGRPNDALPYLERALAIRTAAKMPDALVAETHFYLAAALAASPATRARGVAEARTALELYRRAGDDDDVKQMTIWLAAHR